MSCDRSSTYGFDLWYGLHSGDHIYNLTTIIRRQGEVVCNHWYILDVIRVFISSKDDGSSRCLWFVVLCILRLEVVLFNHIFRQFIRIYIFNLL
jgi:hypothetical protein